MKSLFILLLLLKGSSCFSQTTYTFIGNGFWSLANNWSNSVLPHKSLPGGSEIIISPNPGDSCVLDVSQTISYDAKLTIAAGAIFVMNK